MTIANKASYDKGVKAGLKAAADYVLGTAADYDQMAKRIRDQKVRSDRDYRTLEEYEGKAQIMKGQAGIILELKP